MALHFELLHHTQQLLLAGNAVLLGASGIAWAVQVDGDPDGAIGAPGIFR